MGADLFRSDEWTQAVVREASRKAGEDLERLCLRGPERTLMRASVVQPLMTLISLGYWRRLAAAGVQADIVAGHSLGEIAALAVAGVLTPEQAVMVSLERGRLMDKAAGETPGGMAAVFLPLGEVEGHLRRLGLADQVFIANDNAPAQVVVSGQDGDLVAFVRGMDASHPGICKPLRVSGPWHSPCLREAQVQYRAWLAAVPFAAPVLPLLSNTTAALETTPEACRDNAARQLTERVRWREIMDELKRQGTRVIVEVGPRRVLAGLARINGFGEETVVRGVDSLRAVDRVGAELSRWVAESTGPGS